MLLLNSIRINTIIFNFDSLRRVERFKNSNDFLSEVIFLKDQLAKVLKTFSNLKKKLLFQNHKRGLDFSMISYLYNLLSLVVTLKRHFRAKVLIR